MVRCIVQMDVFGTSFAGRDGGFELITVEQGNALTHQREKTVETLRYRIIDMGKFRSAFESVDCLFKTPLFGQCVAERCPCGGIVRRSTVAFRNAASASAKFPAWTSSRPRRVLSVAARDLSWLRMRR